MSGHKDDSLQLISVLFKQFQKFLAAQSQAMSASFHIGLSSSSPLCVSSSLWVIDFGASHHISPDLSSFVSLSPNSSTLVMTADGTAMPLVDVGSIVIPSLSLSNVYHIPTLTLNLVSVSQLCQLGYLASFSSSTCYVQDP